MIYDLWFIHTPNALEDRSDKAFGCYLIGQVWRAYKKVKLIYQQVKVGGPILSPQIDKNIKQN